MSLTRNEIELINKNYKGNKEDHLMRQYELYVKSSENISTKRMNSNKFYLGANTLLFSVAGTLSILSKPSITIMLSLIGILLCLPWISNLNSYKRINSAKFRIIHELEKELPARLFIKENEYLDNHYNLTSIEKNVPYVFIVFYLALIIFFHSSIIGLLNNLNLVG